MEDTLGAEQRSLSPCKTISLNPCSNGRYSRSSKLSILLYFDLVLILVLMEDTLGGVRGVKALFQAGGE